MRTDIYKSIKRIISLIEELQQVRAEEEVPQVKGSYAALHALRQKAAEIEKGGPNESQA